MTTIVEIPQPIRLHGEKPIKATNFGELVAQLNELDDKHAAIYGKKPDSFQIGIPDLPDMSAELVRIREEIRERLIQLFAASAKELIGNDNKPLMRDYVPIPGQGGPYFDKDDFSVFADDVRRLLNPEDAYFHAALADREVGAIKLLGQTLNFAINHGDPRAAFKHFQKITREVRVQLAASGVPIPQDIIPYVDHELTELPWGDKNTPHAKENGPYRKNILRQRLNVMIQFDYHFKNTRFIEVLHKRFPNQDRFWNELVDVFNAATRDLKVNNFNSEQWFYMLVSRLVRIQQMTRGLYDELVKLTRQIRTATKSQQISAAIDTFVQQTLPAIFPPSPFSSVPLAAAETEKPGPKSS